MRGSNRMREVKCTIALKLIWKVVYIKDHPSGTTMKKCSEI